MGTQVNHYSGAMLFSAVALASGDAAKLSVIEMILQQQDQEAKKLAQESQAQASAAMAVIQGDIGRKMKSASYAEGYAQIASGASMAGAEVGSMGYSGYRAKTSELNHPTEGINTKLGHNQTWRDELSAESPAKMELKRKSLKPVPTDKQTVADAENRLRKIDHNMVDKDPEAAYEGGLSQLRADVSAVKTAGKYDVASPLREAKETNRLRLEERQKDKQSYDNQTDDVKKKLSSLGQISGQLASGAESMEKGKHQELQQEQEAMKQLNELVNTTSRSIVDGLQKVVDQRSQNLETLVRMLDTLSHSNV